MQNLKESKTFQLKSILHVPLTTALQSGGWVPETSRHFHYWQPAPRWRLLPWLANPCGKRKTGTRHTDKTVDREGGTGGDSLQGVPMLRRNANAKKNTD